MMQRFNVFLDWLSNYLAERKGLIPLVGIALVALNFVLGFFPALGWVVRSDLFLHLGVILGLLGFLLAWAL
ncbi:MAG: hypothetical protein D6803_01030 [Anaerolineae bacterium]|nr:MAG: hypothetical protein D6803_01030 [Anaerolineae bacterium]